MSNGWQLSNVKQLSNVRRRQVRVCHGLRVVLRLLPLPDIWQPVQPSLSLCTDENRRQKPTTKTADKNHREAHHGAAICSWLCPSRPAWGSRAAHRTETLHYFVAVLKYLWLRRRLYTTLLQYYSISDSDGDSTLICCSIKVSLIQTETLHYFVAVLKYLWLRRKHYTTLLQY